jgi:hypothetical protein
MERFPVELLYVLAFAGFILFNYLVSRAARRRQQEEQAQAAAQPAPPPAEEEPFEDYWGRAAAPAPARAPVAVSQPVRAAPPAPPPPRRLHPVRALLKNKRDLRRAVILMMVLGPCRAQEPLEPSGPQPQTRP